MDEANRQLTEDEQYVSNLESLVKARTDQLVQFASQNNQLLEVLKQIQSMESLEQVREAVRACIKKFAPEPAQAPEFRGKAGEPVPEVDPEDLEAIWLMMNELQAHSAATGAEVMKNYCKPGANVKATWYRSSMIWMLSRVAQEQIAPWVREGQVSDPVFRTMASIPMEWMGVGIRQDHLPFDAEEFFRRLNAH